MRTYAERLWWELKQETIMAKDSWLELEMDIKIFKW